MLKAFSVFRSAGNSIWTIPDLDKRTHRKHSECVCVSLSVCFIYYTYTNTIFFRIIECILLILIMTEQRLEFRFVIIRDFIHWVNKKKTHSDVMLLFLFVKHSCSLNFISQICSARIECYLLEIRFDYATSLKNIVNRVVCYKN